MKIMIFLLLAFILSGCSSTQSIPIKVDAITSPESAGKTKYYLAPGAAGITTADLQFSEYSSYLNKALAAQGFKNSAEDDAQIAIYVAYGSVTSAAGYGLVNILTARAFDAHGTPEQEGKYAPEVWRVEASTSKFPGDLRRAMPFMIAAIRPYIGKDSKEPLNNSML